MVTVATPKCVVCKTPGRMEVDDQQIVAYAKGALIQHAFPTMSPGQREQLMTGTHPECWVTLFPPEE
jgi:hypothetical protein